MAKASPSDRTNVGNFFDQRSTLLDVPVFDKKST